MKRALVTLTLAAALAGCGGDDPLSAGEYRAELREICKASDQQTARITEPTRATPEAIADWLTRLRDVNARSIERVEKLDPPSELKSAHDRALQANREGRERVDEVIEQLEEGGDPTAILQQATQDLRDTTRAANDAARDLGVPECAD